MPRIKGTKNRTIEERIAELRAKLAELEAKLAAKQAKETEV